MLKRYTKKPMQDLWGSPETKFGYWLKVDLAILMARVLMGRLAQEIYDKIAAAAKIDVKRIEEIEAEVEHDRIAFIKSIHEQLVAAGLGEHKEEFGKYVTSYDIEDPALILMLRDSARLILDEVARLEVALQRLAGKHKWTLMIARTHGQYAEPTTFGHLLLVFSEAVERSCRRLEYVIEHELSEGKISGAVGTHAGLPDRMEERALEVLGLRPANAETQILQRDRHAMVMSVLAVFGGTVNQIANTFWVMMRSDCRELQEPRKLKQRGSSAMPQKKNPIKIEQFRGLPRLLRGVATAAVENIGTEEFREISQSSVERHIFPDGMGLSHYLAVALTAVVEGLVVFEERMLRNLNVSTFGVWAGQQVRIALMDAGVDYDTAYVYVQKVAFMAADSERHMNDVLIQAPISDADPRTPEEILGAEKLQACFDALPYVTPGIEKIFGRCNMGVAAR